MPRKTTIQKLKQRIKKLETWQTQIQQILDIHPLSEVLRWRKHI